LIQTTTTEAPQYYIGLDVRKKTISYCVKDGLQRPSHCVEPLVDIRVGKYGPICAAELFPTIRRKLFIRPCASSSSRIVGMLRSTFVFRRLYRKPSSDVGDVNSFIEAEESVEGISKEAALEPAAADRNCRLEVRIQHLQV
jgi:hypothetical protein